MLALCPTCEPDPSNIVDPGPPLQLSKSRGRAVADLQGQNFSPCARLGRAHSGRAFFGAQAEYTRGHGLSATTARKGESQYAWVFHRPNKVNEVRAMALDLVSARGVRSRPCRQAWRFARWC